MKVSKAAAEAEYPFAMSRAAHTKILFPMMRKFAWKVMQRLEKAGMSRLECLRLFCRAIGHEKEVFWPNDVEQGFIRAGMTDEEFGYLIARDCNATRIKTYKDPGTGEHIEKEYPDNRMSALMRDMVAKARGHYAPQKLQVEGQIGHLHAHLITFDPNIIARKEEIFDPDKGLPPGVEDADDAEYDEVASQ